MHCQDQIITDEPTKTENEEYQIENEVGELKITYATDLEGDPRDIAKERWKFAGYSPAIHSFCFPPKKDNPPNFLLLWSEPKKKFFKNSFSGEHHCYSSSGVHFFPPNMHDPPNLLIWNLLKEEFLGNLFYSLEEVVVNKIKEAMQKKLRKN